MLNKAQGAWHGSLSDGRNPVPAAGEAADEAEGATGAGSEPWHIGRYRIYEPRYRRGIDRDIPLADMPAGRAMSITVKCPNGHVLKVKDKYAGQTGLCPRCQARVLVPDPASSHELTEDELSDILGAPAPVHQDKPEDQKSGGSSGSSLIHASPYARGTKVCPKCKAVVRAVYDLCPHCKTYFSDLSEIIRRLS